MGLGALFLAILPEYWAAIGFLFMFGVSVGTSAVVKPAIIAELYGTARIGQVRSLYTVVMVTSTALAPLVYGLALDMGVTFSTLGIVTALSVMITTLHNLRIYSKI